MDRLSSCYFCGAALDASLDEYPVVPPTLRPDAETRKTVVLCPTCRRKLDAVLESVTEAVDGDGLDGVEETLGDEDVLRSVETGDRSGADAGESGSDDGSTDAGTAADPDDRDGDDQPWISGEEISDGPETTDGESGGGSAPASPEGGAGPDGLDDRRSGESGADQPDGERPEPDETSADRDSGATDDGSSGSAELSDAKLTRLENTKVMRLLENREFPVDRDEFVTVAANAYQVSRDDCDKVIDLAVEHGLLREENGQLYGGDS